jgi:isoquinoline 1-oxidoreductase beta subunit
MNDLLDTAADAGAGLTRRALLVRSLAGGGFMIGAPLAAGLGGTEAQAQAAPAAQALTAWLLLGADDTVTVQVPASEMGQGTMSGLAQVVAEELRVDWARVRAVHAPVDAEHGGRNAGLYGRFTAGSLGMRLFSPGLQQAAANARQMLIEAAAREWGVPAASCSADAGAVSANVGGTPRSLRYGALAATTWDALRAVRGLEVNWTLPADLAARDSAAIDARAAWLMEHGNVLTGKAVNAAGLEAGLAAPNTVIDATYQVPFLAHATMEPLNCTVQYVPTSAGAPARCTAWVPTQSPDQTLQTLKSLCPAGTVLKVNNMLLGGGFGRKFEQDFVREAVQVALACPGKPVKLTWSREEDFANDQYRPMARSRVQAAASAATGQLSAWRHRIVAPSISAQRGGAPDSLDASAVDGARELPYELGTMLVEYVRHDTPVPVGYWRSVGLSINTFSVESAMDELAAALGMDPIELRLRNITDARMTALVQALKALSRWGSAPAAGRARGVALAKGFGSYVGQVAEVSLAAGGGVKVHRVSTVLDCGMAVNPDAVKAQIEGAVAQALAATLWVQQTFVNGVAQARNFNRYRPVRLAEMPQVDVQILNSGNALGGVGEPGVPCVAPAIANALARLQGPARRRRRLPFFPGTTLGEE